MATNKEPNSGVSTMDAKTAGLLAPSPAEALRKLR